MAGKNLKKNSNIKPAKCNLVYQAIPKKLAKVDKLQTTFKGAEGTKIYNDRKRRAVSLRQLSFL